ncbi:uncharacterized protein GGS22DRAFT_100931 [Annulohypoxylon maeteangense]|uniref:uncharacterized protein n=1 Tax=Annulohypoxylon maeteangense TaxID=1927788 RepID=UPI0020082FBE|nr:uncharacterized protein GGS22DRAFT_100931 [Annulohypoxylon maeteangense]KAI0879979.1 hypothetical protein GGS22DRAFT_100931 [Annulohypoxylon maeteangense]
MAPHKGQAKPGKVSSGHVKKPSAVTQGRTIVQPAIPLPMIPKQHTKPAKHTSTPSSTNGFPASSLEAALAGHGDNIAVPVSTLGPVLDGVKALRRPAKAPNGSNVEKPENATDVTNGALDERNDKNFYALTSTSTSASTAAIAAGPTLTTASVNGINGTNTTIQHASIPSVAHAVPSAGSSSSSASVTASANDIGEGARDAVQHILQPQPQPNPSSPSLLLNQQQPPLSHHHLPVHPLQHQISTDEIPDPSNIHGPPRLNHYQRQHQAQHHPHVSNGGGVIFGGFAGSHTPSPVPPPSGFVSPPHPPTMAINGENGIHPRPNGHHHAHSGNGFPGTINTQFRPDVMSLSTIDTYGQVPAPAPAPFDPFSPSVARYGLETPHSIHGSHASGELNGIENVAVPPYHPNGPPYAGHGHHEHPVGHPHAGPHFPLFMPPGPFSRYPGISDNGLGDSIAYFQDQFDNKELTDCVLELVPTKRLHHPVKITGHKLVFARSPALRQHIMAARATDLGSHTITVESDDQYLRSDAWWNAVRRLYLYPLLTPAMLTSRTHTLQLSDDKADRFEFCLGYAAAGHLLNMHDVFLRGLRMAADFLTWSTAEDALAFVFEGAIQRHEKYDDDQDAELDYVYGPDVGFLRDIIRDFIVNAFPVDFEFDPSVYDPPKLARIPPAAGVTPSPMSSIPTIARGTNMRSPTKSQRLTSIKFGDLPAAYPDDAAGPLRDLDNSSPALSRILLNLPFNELCRVLTSQNDGIPGMHTAQIRYHAIADVVAEREARRLRAVEAVRAGLVPNSEDIQQRLSAQRRYAIVEPWDVLNWEETVIQPTGAELPRMVRTWVSQFAVASDGSQHQLKPLQYESRNSMV